MGEIEEKLKLEMDITALKREHKNLSVQVNAIKNEYASTFSIVEDNKKLIEEQRSYLSEIQNDISNAKLNWISEKEAQMEEVNDMKNAAQNVLNRKGELNEQEERIRQLEASDIEVRNETRRLELKLEEEKKGIASREKELAEKNKKHEAEKAKLLQDKKGFKEKVTEVLKQIENL